MRLVSALRAVSWALSLWSCVPSGPGRAVVVSVSDEEGRPLAGRSVEIDGRPALKTRGDGKAHLSLAAEGPPRARVAIKCPEGSREPNPRHVARASEGATAQLELSFVCRPSLRLVAVVVRAEAAAGSVLRADGEPVGTVSADGTLHAALWRAPDSELQLMLDTSTLAVRPRNPLREHRVADRDELLLFEQSFQVPAPAKRLARWSSRDSFGGRR